MYYIIPQIPQIRGKSLTIHQTNIIIKEEYKVRLNEILTNSFIFVASVEAIEQVVPLLKLLLLLYK